MSLSLSRCVMMLCGGGDDGGGVGTFYFPECFSGQFNGVSERKCC